ncbi:SEC-C metal-binding domain-containing protein, partial [Planococcus sp. SIMBA_143]
KRNDDCPCGSGKKYKHCCINGRNIVKHKNLDGIFNNYYIVFDSSVEREYQESLHLYDTILANISEALWYCLHLPRNGMDVIYSPDWLFTK